MTGMSEAEGCGMTPRGSTSRYVLPFEIARRHRQFVDILERQAADELGLTAGRTQCSSG